MSKLVIVESPTKAKTISKFLGKEYKVESSYGHIRDLPKSKMGIDIKNDFAPEYVIPKEAQKRVTALKKLAKAAPEVILATDEDREGEAIAWHLRQALDLSEQKSHRIVFHEITKSAIEEALKNPRQIDEKLVDAQQARRILDRLVGYELSPFLWKKVKRGLSAGRVQSVALRLVVEREREIEKFKSQEYWSIEAKLKKEDDPETQAFVAKLSQIDGKGVKKFDIGTATEAQKIVNALADAAYRITDITEKEARRFPAAPFTTSTLQQEAGRKLGFSAKQTMMVAQQLYETGYITYMRTDSVNLAEQALRQAQEVIVKKFGRNYALASPRRYKTKSKGAQEAHEAIRPTDLAQEPEILEGGLEPKQARLYDLIWKRTLASQMAEAVFDQTAVDIAALPAGRQVDAKYLFRATGQVVKFEGFIKVYTEGRDEEETDELPEGQLPKLEKNETLEKLTLDPKQHFTEPPPRYTDATLVKTLEEYGIGRPSTYAPTISTIIERGYVNRQERKFYPTDIGLVVNDMLVENFPEIVDYQFTAQMEKELDDIAEGQLKWQPVIKKFYTPFKSHLEEKQETVEKHVEMTDIPCPICGKPMVKKFGRFGAFLACSDYPNCKGTKPLPADEAIQKKLEAENAGKTCPECGQGQLVVKRGKFGYFLGCNRYPECKYIGKIEKKTGVTCPKCNQGEIVEKRTRKARTFWGCNRYPECDYATWKYPVAENKEIKTEEK
jgi:DNA topoisomerase-1